MNKSDRLQYLKQKRTEYKAQIEHKKKQDNLNQFLSELNSLEINLASITSSDIDISNIANPALYNKPKLPLYKELRYKTKEEEFNVKNEIKQWILRQNSEHVLIKTEFLIENNDWLKLNAKSLYHNFDSLFEKLDILHTIMLSAKHGNFITLFEFENRVTIYQGKLQGNEIEYTTSNI
jgi:hypothetical protein